MTNKQLFNGIDSADDKFIIEALEDDAYLYSDIERKHRFGGMIKVALPCAACAALIFGALIGGQYFNGVNPVSSAEGNIADVSTDLSETAADVSDISEASEDISDNSEISADVSDNSENLIQHEPFRNAFLDPVTPDPATFWEGELPVLPVKEFDNDNFKLSLDKESGWSGYWLETERGSAVYAVADGEVYFIGERVYAHGMSIVIKHNDNLYTAYDAVDIDCGIPVNVGDKVKAGQVIGYAGLFFDLIDNTYDVVKNGIVYDVYTYDPLDTQKMVYGEYLNEWINSAHSKPLDYVGDDFDFRRFTVQVSRNEPVIPASKGANVYAVDSGEVIRAEYFGNGLGYIVEIEHRYDDEEVECAGVISMYYHLGSDLTVKKGDIVESGDIIGHISGDSLSGESGLGYCIDDFWLLRKSSPENERLHDIFDSF